jgi:palmitoyl-protein thioesterase
MIKLIIFLLSVTTHAVPVVLWHGMGDSYNSKNSMLKVIQYINEVVPGTFVHSISTALDNPVDSSADAKSSYFGNFNDQIDHVCRQLKSITELADGFNAIGFSQGGLGLRGYVEKCNSPRVLKLVTIGTPHAGVADIPRCDSFSNFWCSLMRKAVSKGVYWDDIQRAIIQAQYYRVRTTAVPILIKFRTLMIFNVTECITSFLRP